MFIYVIVNSETLKIYIGQHKGTNLRQYLQQKWSEAKRGFAGRSHLYASMRKHSRQSWSIHPLILDLQTREECNYWERLLIKALNSQNPEVGYNICRGGEGFTGPHTAAALQKMDERRTKYWSKPENHQKRRAVSKAVWMRPGFRQKVSEILKTTPCETRFQLGHVPSPLAGAKGPNQTSFVVGNKPWNTGTKGIKKANSGSFRKGHHLNRGRVFTQAHRDALSQAHRRNKTI